MDIAKVLTFLRPGEQWVLRGESYADLEWLCSTKKPTLAELTEASTQVEELSYQEKRDAAYPSIKDQLDAIWKGGTAMEIMRSQIMDVKKKYPK